MRDRREEEYLSKSDSIQFDQYSAMGHDMTDFEACYTFTPKGNFHSVRHCHDFYELYLHIQGGQTLEIDQSVYEMHPCQLFIIPPFSMHELSSKPNADYERAFLYIHPDVLKTCGCGQLDLNHLFQTKAANGTHCFSLMPEKAKLCAKQMLSLRENQKREDPLARFRDYALLLPILEIMTEAISLATTTAQPEAGQSAIRDILHFVNENYMRPLRVEILAQRFGVSVSYLAHEFKRYTGRSVYDYILHRRMMLAKKLIPECDSLNAVSEQCGFENYSNFLRLFYKYVGVSPSGYRKSLKEYS